ncbi:Stk1 family PASTA domain-containing Ser/Thr kinase [Oceanobacillus polygoni]|uniref:Serine/threonine-protein kinase PrkC n=1 Tax=Oceanobacillus polygoni TaxID=1235259 RepID=A0A9X0YRR5_9BACI|nr:Stk1 family PASTA domain-containing Ser/Thr kinase [Oceanobacillus polygoni]MBP2077597.1 serine/threonine-protein kinase [Oceanobacillus polygoni]
MRSGHLLNERYKIIEKIGGGGMANVYLARDTILNRDVAVKALRMEYIHDDEFIARFDREAQSATSLSHPNIVNIYDVGEEDQVLYMVMEYVDGMTLKEYIQNYGPIDVQEALDIMKQLISAIAHAHANDIVHRDIKPQNILMNSFGQAKVTDFGIAIALSATSLTQTNSILGSVHYLSPEQARGGMATKKSDIYSIGIVLYELLTGKLPFSGQSPVSIALKHLQTSTPSVRRFNQDIPQSVENIVLKATAKDPFHRYENIYELEEAVENALHPDKLNEPLYAPPVEVGEETKAIPIITDQQIEEDMEQATLVHQFDEGTKNYPEDNPAENSAGKKVKKAKKGKKPAKAKPAKKKRGKKKWIMILVVLFLLLAAGVAAMFIIPDLMQPKDVIVKDVSEYEVEEARDILEADKFVVEEEETYSDEIEEGLVVQTDPRAGRTAKEGSTVTLFVSQGKERVTFEDYVGRDFSQVSRLLEDEGFTNVMPIEKHSDRPAGEIITQIQPEPGSEVVPSEERVIFEVSIGPEAISLNNLVGMTIDEAKSYLDGENLVMNVIEENSETVPEGEVTRQDPASGAEVEEDSTVNVYISTGPEARPPRSHTISLTVPYNPVTEEEENPEEDEEEQEDQEDQDGQEEEPEPVEQVVRIYIGDANNEITDVYREEVITEDREFEFTLTIAPDSEAEYTITRDDEVIRNRTVSYDGEEE